MKMKGDGKMKRLLLSIMFLLLFAVPAAAQQAEDFSFSWDANTEPDLAGYKVYYGNVRGTYGNVIDVVNVTQYTLTGLQPGTYYIVVTAYDTSMNESEYSNEIDNDPPDNPTGLTITAKTVNIIINP